MLKISEVPGTKFPFRVVEMESDVLGGDDRACFRFREEAELFIGAKETTKKYGVTGVDVISYVDRLKASIEHDKKLQASNTASMLMDTDAPVIIAKAKS